MIKTKPIMEIKTGIWVNRDKMRRLIDKISLLYILIFVVIMMMAYMIKGYGIIMLSGIMIVPLILLRISLGRYEKGVKENGEE